MKYCKIVKVSSRTGLTGSEFWVLTHECGKIEERKSRTAHQRHIAPAPKRVACDSASKPKAATDV